MTVPEKGKMGTDKIADPSWEKFATENFSSNGGLHFKCCIKESLFEEPGYKKKFGVSDQDCPEFWGKNIARIMNFFMLH